MALDKGENPGMGSAYKIPVWLLISPSKNIEGQFVDVPTGDSGFFFFFEIFTRPMGNFREALEFSFDRSHIIFHV